MKSHLLTFLAVTIIGGFLIGFGCRTLSQNISNYSGSRGAIVITSIDDVSKLSYAEGEALKFQVVPPPEENGSLTLYKWTIDSNLQSPVNFEVHLPQNDIAIIANTVCGDNNQIPQNNRCCVNPDDLKSIICTAPKLPSRFTGPKDYAVRVELSGAGGFIAAIGAGYSVQKPSPEEPTPTQTSSLPSSPPEVSPSPVRLSPLPPNTDDFLADFELGYSKALSATDFNRRPQNIFAADDVLKFHNLSQCNKGTCTYSWEFKDFTPASYSTTTQGWDSSKKTFTGMTPPPTTISSAVDPRIKLTVTNTAAKQEKEIEFHIGEPIVYSIGVAVNIRGTWVTQNVCQSSSPSPLRAVTGEAVRLDTRPGILTGEIDPTTGRIANGGGALRSLTWQLGCRAADANGQPIPRDISECEKDPPLLPIISCNNLQDISCATKTIYFDNPGEYRVWVTATNSGGAETLCRVYLTVTQGSTSAPSPSIDFTLDSTTPPMGEMEGLGVRAPIIEGHYIIDLYDLASSLISMTFKTPDATFGQAPYTYTWATSRGTGTVTTTDPKTFTVDRLQNEDTQEIIIRLVVTDETGKTVSKMKRVTVNMVTPH